MARMLKVPEYVTGRRPLCQLQLQRIDFLCEYILSSSRNVITKEDWDWGPSRRYFKCVLEPEGLIKYIQNVYRLPDYKKAEEEYLKQRPLSAKELMDLAAAECLRYSL